MEVLREGFASKEGGWPKTWKQRWFVLTPDQLVYYTKDDRAKEKGRVDRNTVKDVRLGEHAKRPLIVQVDAVDRKGRNRTFNFSFSSATERLEWLHELRLWAGMESVVSPNRLSSFRQQEVVEEEEEEEEEQKKEGPAGEDDKPGDVDALQEDQVMEALVRGELTREQFENFQAKRQQQKQQQEQQRERSPPHVRVDLSPEAVAAQNGTGHGPSFDPTLRKRAQRGPSQAELDEKRALEEAKALRDRLLSSGTKPHSSSSSSAARGQRGKRLGIKSPIEELRNIGSTSHYDVVHGPNEGKTEWELSLLRIDFAAGNMDRSMKPQLTTSNSVKNLHAPTPTNGSSRRQASSANQLSASGGSSSKVNRLSSSSSGGSPSTRNGAAGESTSPQEAVFERLSSTVTDSIRASNQLTRQQSEGRLIRESMIVGKEASSARKNGSQSGSPKSASAEGGPLPPEQRRERMVMTPKSRRAVNTLEGPSLQKQGLVEDDLEVNVAGCRTHRLLTQSQVRRRQQEQELKRKQKEAKKKKEEELARAREEFRQRTEEDHALDLYRQARHYKMRKLQEKHARHFSFSPRTNWNRPESASQAAKFAVSDGRSPPRQRKGRPSSAPGNKTAHRSSPGRQPRRPPLGGEDALPVAQPLRANSHTSMGSSGSSEGRPRRNSGIMQSISGIQLSGQRGTDTSSMSSQEADEAGPSGVSAAGSPSHMRERPLSDHSADDDFHPELDLSIPVHERLYLAAMHKRERIAKKAEEEKRRRQEEEVKEVRPQPHFFTKYEGQNRVQTTPLMLRLNDLQARRRARMEELRKELEKKQQEGATFAPQLWRGSLDMLRQAEEREREILEREEAEYRRRMEEKMQKIQDMEEQRQELLMRKEREESEVAGEEHGSTVTGESGGSLRVKEALHSNKYSLRVLEEEEALLERINKLALEEIEDPHERFQNKRFMFGSKDRYEFLYRQAQLRQQRINAKRKELAKANSYTPKTGRAPRGHGSPQLFFSGSPMHVRQDLDRVNLAELSLLPEEQRDWLLENESLGQGILNDEKLLRYLMLCDLSASTIPEEDDASSRSSGGSAPATEPLQQSKGSSEGGEAGEVATGASRDRQGSVSSRGSDGAGSSSGSPRSSPNLTELRRKRTYSRVGQLNMIVQANSAPIPQLQDISGDEASSLSSRQSVQKELEDLHRRSFDTILSPEKQREELQRLAAEADAAASSSPSSSVSREKKEGEVEEEDEVAE